IKTGMEIQNWASNAPRRFGSRCRRMSLRPENPEALAIHTNSDFISALAPEQITRAEAAQPSSPSKAKVTVTDAWGEMFSGSTARTVIRRKSQGTERKKSISSLQQRSVQPPKYPASPPIKAARKVVKSAARGARVREMRIP